MEQQPSVGRIIHFFPAGDDPEARANGNGGPIAGVITRVWGNEIVNLTLFPDSHQPVLRTSVPMRRHPVETGVWDWPARV